MIHNLAVVNQRVSAPIFHFLDGAPTGNMYPISFRYQYKFIKKPL